MPSTFRPRTILLALTGLGVAVLFGCGSPAPTVATSTPKHDQDGHDHHGHDHDGHDHNGHDHADHDHADHDHEQGEHAEPKTFAEALAEFEELHTAMAAAFAAGETEKADGPLHEAGHLLEAMAKFAESESFSAADLTAVKAATEELLDLLGEVDDRVHGGETKGKAFSEVAAQVTDALARLRAIKTPEEKS